MSKITVAGFLLIFVCFAVFSVFSGAWILPQSFRAGPLKIHYYGLTMAMAAAAGFWMAAKRSARFGLARASAEDLLFWTTLAGFIGARLYHVMSSFEYYRRFPADIFKVWNGGLSIYGAVIGGFIAVIIFKKYYAFRISIITILDWLTPSLLLGQIIGRFGNFFNYEAFGYPTTLPWKMFVPENFRPPGFEAFGYFHPWFLYEQSGNLAILIFILALERRAGRRSRPPLFFFYLLLYNLLRFCLEFLRIDSTFAGPFRQNAIVSLAAAIAALVLIYSHGNNDKKDFFPA